MAKMSDIIPPEARRLKIDIKRLAGEPVLCDLDEASAIAPTLDERNPAPTDAARNAALGIGVYPRLDIQEKAPADIWAVWVATYPRYFQYRADYTQRLWLNALLSSPRPMGADQHPERDPAFLLSYGVALAFGYDHVPDLVVPRFTFNYESVKRYVRRHGIPPTALELRWDPTSPVMADGKPAQHRYQGTDTYERALPLIKNPELIKEIFMSNVMVQPVGGPGSHNSGWPDCWLWCGNRTVQQGQTRKILRHNFSQGKLMNPPQVNARRFAYQFMPSPVDDITTLKQRKPIQPHARLANLDTCHQDCVNPAHMSINGHATGQEV